ncbi:ABC transporter ATP-binding protein [Schaalia sp. lx-260]|uniref:ABC transporter ATP-binding protein n=1 Tax=Schaalia sp. lx-260 TaxID=2899082 RepID=UPI001E5AD2AB|nr:ABC transporter ATP-binding protein [Schaalia sp. lx-260]MCD4549218.1 ABC transporter ATP-binding protein [Schaalia sp. lx-260]
MLLTASDLVRDFRAPHSSVRAVNHVSFTLDSGEILGLVGLNGAGKTTLVSLCTTMLAPTSGSLTICGVNALKRPLAARRFIGVSLGGDSGFYLRSTVEANLRFFASLASIPPKEHDQHIMRLLRLVDLTQQSHTEAGALSRGQYQRLHIARALLGHTRILILDEATMGLDPDSALHIRSLIARIACEGTGIILTSHSMEEIEDLATRIVLMDHGSFIAQGTSHDIISYAGLTQVAHTLIAAHNLARFDEKTCRTLLGDQGAVSLRPVGVHWKATFYWHKNPDDLVAFIHTYCTRQKIPIPQDIRLTNAQLQDAFIYLSRRNAPER